MDLKSGDRRKTNWFTKETLLIGTLISFLGWLGVQSVSSKEAIAALQVSQLEDNKVNSLVYTTLPAMHENLKNIVDGSDKIKSIVIQVQDDVDEVKINQNAWMYCFNTYPDQNNTTDRDQCLKKLSKDS